MERDTRLQNLNLADIYRELGDVREEIERIGTVGGRGGVNLPTTPTVPIAQAANQLRNGSFAHSIRSWENQAATGDGQYECAHWYSHPDTPNHPLHTWDTNTPGTKTFTDGNVTTGTDNVNVAAHGYLTGDAVRLTTTGVLPAGLALATTYYIIKTDADNIEFAASLTDAYAGTPSVDITAAAGGGTHTITPINYTLKSDDHPSYAASQTNWTRSDSPAGVARLNEDWTLDAPLVQPTAEPGYTMFAVFNCALANRYIYAPPGARITCGLYALQDGEWDYLRGDFTVTAEVSGTVGTPTSRDYRIHARTSRGFSILSDVTTVASAPSDSDFTGGARVVLSWPKPLQFGIIGYDIYRLTGATYVLLERVETGLTSYIDNNSSLPESVSGYPSADLSGLAPFTATQDSVVANLAIDGVDTNWDTLPFALRVPANYDHSLTDFSRKQWVRWNLIGLNGGRFDIRVTDANLSAGDETLTSASGQFTAGMVGKTVVLTNTKHGESTTVHTTTIASYTSPTEVELTADAGLNRYVDAVCVIEGAADTNVLYLDLAHLSFGESAIFGFHPDDLSPDRGTPPVAANGSNQGGTSPPAPGGGGGAPGDDGAPICPWIEEMVTVTDGSGSIYKKKAGDLLPTCLGGEYAIVGHRMSAITSLKYGIADVWEATTQNGYKARTSDTHKYLTGPKDKHGRKLASINVGDPILTQIEGEDVETTLESKYLVEKRAIVVEIGLAPTPIYLIGDGPGRWGGIASHNAKKNPDFEIFA